MPAHFPSVPVPSVSRTTSQSYQAAATSLHGIGHNPITLQSGATLSSLHILPNEPSNTLNPEPPHTSFSCPSTTAPTRPAKHSALASPTLATPTSAAPARKRSTSRVTHVNDPFALRTYRLGTLVQSLAHDLQSAGSWENFINAFRGESYLSPELDNLEHPAANLLREWRDHGVPAQTSSPPWSEDTKDSYVERGCHRSANEHAEFLRDEMSEFIDSRFWVVLPYSLVCDTPQLQLSPAAVKEERERRPRLLCDHSWYPVNETTCPHAPPEAMQFGGALHRVMAKIRHANPSHGPVHLCKYDIKDGYYRMFLNANDCPRLSIILARYEGEEQLIAIPHSTELLCHV